VTGGVTGTGTETGTRNDHNLHHGISIITKTLVSGNNLHGFRRDCSHHAPLLLTTPDIVGLYLRKTEESRMGNASRSCRLAIEATIDL